MATLAEQMNGTRVVSDSGPRKPANPASSSALMAELESLRKANAELAAKLANQRNAGELRVRFNNGETKDPKTGKLAPAKKGFSVMGLNAQFPITLYAGQWIRLAEYLPTVLECVADNIEDCAVKDEADRAVFAEKLEQLLK